MNEIKQINNKDYKRTKVVKMIVILISILLLVSAFYNISNTKITYEVKFIFYNSKITVKANKNQSMEKVLTANKIKIDLDDVIYINDKVISTSEFKDMKINSNIEVIVDLVGIEKVVETKEISFKTTVERSDNLLVGKEEISVVGENGIIEETYEIIELNGVEISKTLIKTTTIKNVVNEVKLIGTKTSETNIITTPIENNTSPSTTPIQSTTNNCTIWVVDTQNPNGKCVK